MGQHSSTEQWPFYRSVVGWFLPWLVIAAVLGTAVWIAVGTGDGSRPAGGADGATTSTPGERRDGGANSGGTKTAGTKSATRPGGREAPTGRPGSPGGKGTAKERPKVQAGGKGQTGASGGPLITEGISVQVLNSTPSAPAADDMAGRLGGLGFDVVAIEESARSYPQTTVFWSFASSETAATRLAGRFGWVAAAKPVNLSSEVDVHVVVGGDEV